MDAVDYSHMDEMGEYGMEDYDYEGHNYYDSDSMSDHYEDAELYERISLTDLADKCLSPTISQAIAAVFPLMIICFTSRLMHIFFSEECSESGFPRTLLHVASAVLGLMAAQMFFEASFTFLVILALVAYLQMCVAARALKGHTGPMTAGLVVTFVLACELFIVGGEDWHRIRGAQMVLAMKVISLGFDIDKGHVPAFPSLWQYCGYVFHPGSVVFGPWASYREYITLYTMKKKKTDVYWVLKVISSTLLGLFCVLHSTCTVQWLILDNWGSWSLAYRDAQGFRFSHYFVSYVSEVTSTLSGMGSSAAKPAPYVNGHKGNSVLQPPKQLNGDVRWDMAVTRPLHMELPRSLSEVVSNWNLPMHYWLKHYVFHPSRQLGTFPAVLLTYAASSILHGLNFQLAAVLLSLGFYSYIEHQFRLKLSRIFDACIGSKRCKDHCDHRNKAAHLPVMLVNLLFGLLTVFHLSYLGLMFDNSEGQEEGYTMGHTLGKWASLNYASHVVALTTYIIYLLL